ncbi:hypothetical protein AJ80_07944 [Polytolypa hystricis UAMH7299]|uniref:Uncharacterized protein n=1 Tax=Polytolypa hystricis (strain UAMH7299) TaxID=1447883 RepID=A0A2B7XFQ4_POLH7|nr:hypothetical protein AJ80_07944 [Polytolypa hystricis UAMH7299]
MSISKLNASWLSGHNENTLALANLNFDFSVFKVEPPPEYDGLRVALSSSRREAAEDGDLHQTARRLSALFRPLLPKTPTLIKAYGTRVSEISKKPTPNRNVGLRFSAMFSDWVGIDATSIWAAATSGPGAISAHLLACMIARVFTTSEATSIWYELVERRKEQLEKMVAEGMADISDELASRCNVSRAQLAEWDASARAWLQSADQIMTEKQSRLTRALEGLRLPVENGPELLDTVMKACTAALETMERLIEGTAQRVQTPAVLLGLSSWHIYPDLLVLGNVNIEPIKQLDPLVSNGGLLTIGMQLESGSDESIFWSLPLSFLRWYGDPVVTTGYIGPGHSRISPTELLFVTLGCLFEQWGPIASNNDFAASWVSLIFDVCKNSNVPLALGLHEPQDDDVLTHNQSWLYLLNRAAQAFLDSEDTEKREYQRLISFGRRKSSFLGEPASQIDSSRAGYQLKSLSNRSRVFHPNLETSEDESRKPMFGFLNVDTILKCLETPEERVELLRKVAERKCLDPTRYVIIYKKGTWQRDSGRVYENAFSELASIAPVLAASTRKRHTDGEEKRSSTLLNVRWRSAASVQIGEKLSGHDEPFFTAPEELFSLMGTNFFLGSPWSAIVWLPRHMILSNATFQPISDSFQMNRDPSEVLPEDMRTLLPDCRLNLSRIKQQFKCSGSSGVLDRKGTSLTRMLLSITSILSIYKLLPSATISTKILQRPMPEELSTEINAIFVPSGLSREVAFALVAYCESGNCILKPQSLLSVFALSTGNSIFVYGALLADPSEPVNIYELRRLHGNIGRPGTVLLISPTNPRVRKPDDEHWKVINHDLFDGKNDDCFKSTSLHISFTNYVLPLSVQDSGNIDSEAYLLESVVSIHDKGEWVADIDILTALAGKHDIRSSCNGTCSPEVSGVAPFLDSQKLVAIDCWEELLEPPRGHLIARAHNNWVARLALLSVAHQKEYSPLVLPPDFCHKCSTNILAWFNYARALDGPRSRLALIM